MNGLMPREQNSDHQISLGGPVYFILKHEPSLFSFLPLWASDFIAKYGHGIYLKDLPFR